MASYSPVDDLVTCGLTACTPGSAPGPTLVNEYGKTLLFIVGARGPRRAGDGHRKKFVGHVFKSAVFDITQTYSRLPFLHSRCPITLNKMSFPSRAVENW